MLVALGLVALAPRLEAQDPDARTRALLARAESLEAVFRARDSAEVAARRRARRARLYEIPGLSLVLPATVPSATAAKIARGALTYLDEFGGVPRPFVASAVVFAYGAEDTAVVLGNSRFHGRLRIGADLGHEPDSLVAGWRVATSVAGTYRASLDGDWREFLPGDYGVDWVAAREAPAALRALTEVATAFGAECVAGKVDACRRWLGIDRDPDPFAVRYRPSELRSLIAQLWYAGRDSLSHACLDGSDDGCDLYAGLLATRGVIVIPPTPATDPARRSLIRAVHALHGPDAVRRALADTTGSVGERLARAAGVSEDSLVAEWRYWVLTRGGRPRVTAGIKDGIPVVLMAGLLLFAAARSGRWR